LRLGSGFVSSSTPTPATARGDQEASRWDQVPRWYTVAQAAELCHRHPRTILNHLSAYGLPRKSGWVTRHRRRRKQIVLRADVVAWLVEITLLNNAKARLDPPR
jgi:hypothetical protein